MRFAPSVLVRNTDFAQATDPIEPPAPGTSADCIAHSTCTGEVSFDGGATFSAFSSQAVLTVRITADSSPISSITRHFGTEILDLTVSIGGGTAGGPSFKLRESPTKQSLGTSSKRLSNGGYMIGQSIQVCLEVSLDNGTTWTPADAPLRLSLLPYVEQTGVCKTDFMPPRTGTFEADPPDAGVSYALTQPYLKKKIDKWQISNCSASQPLPARRGDTAVIDFSCTVSCDVSEDDGATWVPFEGPGTCTMAVTNPLYKEDSSVSNNPLYDTEMLALIVTLPNGMKVRESPTKASTGKTSMRNRILELESVSYAIDSFFDVFTELSVDDGQTWVAGDDCVHLAMHNAPDPAFVRSDWMPYATQIRACDGDFAARFSSTGFVRGLDFDCDSSDALFSARATMPAPGSPPVIQEMSVPASFEYSTDGGTTHTTVHASAALTLRCDEFSAASTSTPGSSCRIEVLQCDISGLPGAPMLRESPTKQSLGKLHQAPAASGAGFTISSFFDVFLELSTDGGIT